MGYEHFILALSYPTMGKESQRDQQQSQCYHSIHRLVINLASNNINISQVNTTGNRTSQKVGSTHDRKVKLSRK